MSVETPPIATPEQTTADGFLALWTVPWVTAPLWGVRLGRNDSCHFEAATNRSRLQLRYPRRPRMIPAPALNGSDGQDPMRLVEDPVTASLRTAYTARHVTYAAHVSAPPVLDHWHNGGGWTAAPGRIDGLPEDTPTPQPVALGFAAAVPAEDDGPGTAKEAMAVVLSTGTGWSVGAGSLHSAPVVYARHDRRGAVSFGRSGFAVEAALPSAVSSALAVPLSPTPFIRHYLQRWFPNVHFDVPPAVPEPIVNPRVSLCVTKSDIVAQLHATARRRALWVQKRGEVAGRFSLQLDSLQLEISSLERYQVGWEWRLAWPVPWAIVTSMRSDDKALWFGGSLVIDS